MVLLSYDLNLCLVCLLLTSLAAYADGQPSATNANALATTRCNREPTTTSNGKMSGDNGYRILVSGNPEKYVPGESYTVKLQGWKLAISTQKFIGFMLVVEAAEPGHETEVKDSGKFKLLGDVYTRFSDQCQNAVIETSPMVKEEVQVLWVAPKPGSGCVKFKATVIEHRDRWLMDDGRLTKELCEEEQDNPDSQTEVIDECCACDDAKYEVTFQGLWSRHTHPKDFPQDNFQTHFSDIIGASHTPSYTMWEYGGYASEGLKAVAETGSTRLMEAEMKQQSDNIRTIIKARGLWFPNLNGSTFAVFRVDRKHHLMSLVSMLGPSPDWIAGVSRMELCLRNCSWVAHRTLNLNPWDVGTDSGYTYTAAKSPSVPREKIRRITSSFPNNPNSPFYDPSGEQMKPVARLTLTRQRLYEKPCDAETYPAPEEEDIPVEVPEDDQRMECTVTNWSNYSPCSVTCGKGKRMRTRQYVMPMKADMVGCTTQLVQKENCQADTISCNRHGNGDDEDDSELWREEAKRCSLSTWSPWSECSATCGKGMTTRSRNYKNPQGRKSCFATLMEKQPCMAEVKTCEHAQQEDPQCVTTQWSEWSPCMVTCGKGFRVRTRLYINPKAQGLCRAELMEKQPCVAPKADCNFDLKEATEICSQPKDAGPCRGYFNRWYFDTVKKTCLQFSYGGCRGNQNNFKQYEQCNQVCDVMKGNDMLNRINPNPVILAYTMRDSTSVHVDNQHGLVCVPFDSPALSPTHDFLQTSLQALRQKGLGKGRDAPVDCVSQWTPWTPCSVSCGLKGGFRSRHRTIKVMPQNGGKECPKRQSQRRACNVEKPC